MKKAKIHNYKQEEETFALNWENYKGRIVAVIGDKIFGEKDVKKARKMIAKIEKKYKKTPLITYIPEGASFHFPTLAFSRLSR